MNVRVETSPPPGIEETPEGFLRFWLRIADPSAVYEYPDRGETHTVSAEVLCAPEWLDALAHKPLTLGHPHGGSRFVTVDDAQAYAVGHVMETGVYGDEPYARVQADTPAAVEWVRAREGSGFYCSPMYSATVEEVAPGEMEQTARLSANHLALTDSPRGGSRCRVILTLGDETLTGLRIALTPAAPDLTKAIEKIAEVVPGFVAAPILEIDLLVGIPADKAEAALAEIERAAEVCRARKEGPPVSHFYGVVADPPAADGSRAIILLGYASPYLYEAAERLLGPDRPVSAMPSPSRLHIGSTPEPLTTAQIEAIGSLRFVSDDEIAIACATLSLLGGDAPVAVILADEVEPPSVPPTKEGRVPLPEKTAAALAGLSEEQRAMLEPVLAAMVEDVGAMLAAVKPEPVADMGKEKMLADEAKGLKADNARLTRERDAAVAEAKSAKVSAARPAVARFAAAQGVPLADSADEAAIIAAAEAATAKAGRPVKGLAALDAVALADSLAPAVERQRLSDPPKVEPTTKPLHVDA
jgi:hypothetical protein